MLEYVFFNSEPCGRFRAFLEEQGLPSDLAEGEVELVVQVEESRVDDALADVIDTFYDEMFEIDQKLYEQSLEQGPESYHASGVVVNLKDGRSVYAGVRPALLNKVMQAVSPEELGELVDAIVAAVEEPDERSVCRRMAGDERGGG